MMKRRALSNFLFFFPITVSLLLSACTHKGVQGFQDLKWGMSAKDVQKSPAWSTSFESSQGRSPQSASKVSVLGNLGGVSIDGSPVIANAFFLDGKLRSVRLVVGDFNAKNVSRFYDLVASKYGESAQGQVTESEKVILDTSAAKYYALYKSWQDDTIALYPEDVKAGRILVLIYREAGAREAFQSASVSNRQDL